MQMVVTGLAMKQLVGWVSNNDGITTNGIGCSGACFAGATQHNGLLRAYCCLQLSGPVPGEDVLNVITPVSVELYHVATIGESAEGGVARSSEL